jgi:hypothetical protein
MVNESTIVQAFLKLLELRIIGSARSYRPEGHPQHALDAARLRRTTSNSRCLRCAMDSVELVHLQLIQEKTV